MTLAELRENFELQYNLFNNVRAALGVKAVWSICDVVDFNEIAFTDTIENIHYKDHWGLATVTVDVNKARLTWLDLYRIADTLIAASGDMHHLFIESFDRQENDLYLTTGS